MNVEELERLMEMVKNANIGELTLKQNGSRVTIRRAPQGAVQTETTGMALVVSDSQELTGYGEAVVSGDADAAIPVAEEENLVMVNAPLVGVFHHVKPVVGLGARVAPGQVIATIESMRLVHEIIAPAAGKVVDVLIEDSLPVEYGQPLFALAPIE